MLLRVLQNNYFNVIQRRLSIYRDILQGKDIEREIEEQSLTTMKEVISELNE
jgi:hypothetical protein